MTVSQHKSTIHEHLIGEEEAYVKALAVRYPGMIEFESGAAHVFSNLNARLPIIPELENSKSALCKRIAEAVYPLATFLYAQEVCITVITSSHPLPPPDVVAGIATYTVFDPEHDVVRHCFLSAEETAAGIEKLAINSGIAVLCEPLNYDQKAHNSSGGSVSNRPTDEMWEWTQRMVNQWYDHKALHPFVPERLRLRTAILTGAQILGIVETAAVAGLAAATDVSPKFGTHDTSHKITRAFIHEAGYAETAAMPKAANSRLSNNLQVSNHDGHVPQNSVEKATPNSVNPKIVEPSSEIEPVDAHQHMIHHVNHHDPDVQ